jgi:hypothetical protein
MTTALFEADFIYLGVGLIEDLGDGLRAQERCEEYGEQDGIKFQGFA